MWSHWMHGCGHTGCMGVVTLDAWVWSHWMHGCGHTGCMGVVTLDAWVWSHWMHGCGHTGRGRISRFFTEAYLPDSNLKAMLLEPYWRMWSTCHLTMRRGNSSSVNMAMWNRLRSKSLKISSKHGPLKARDLALRSFTRNVSSSGMTASLQDSNSTSV